MWRCDFTSNNETYLGVPVKLVNLKERDHVKDIIVLRMMILKLTLKDMSYGDVDLIRLALGKDKW